MHYHVEMLTARAIASLSQYFALLDRDWIEVLFGKHGVATPELGHWARGSRIDPPSVKTFQEWLTAAAPHQVEAILSEVVRTQGSFRNRVSPRYTYDERWRDVEVCLALDGYVIQSGKLLRAEPSLDDDPAIEDDLTQELNRSGLSTAGEVVRLLLNSAEDFRRSPADLNGALTNARVALQTLATEISRQHQASRPRGFDESKWGQVVTHLRTADVVTQEEEKGVAGVFTFVSPGAHTPVGLSDSEMVRLGRSLVISMCYFLVKRWNG